MNTQQRADIRGALIAQGFRRYWAHGDETKCAVIHAVQEIQGERRAGCYTELFKHPDGTIASITWTEKTTSPWRNC